MKTLVLALLTVVFFQLGASVPLLADDWFQQAGGKISKRFKGTGVGQALIDLQEQAIAPERRQYRMSKLEERLLAPQIEWADPDGHPSDVYPVYFVNGILNTAWDARQSNKLLSRQLRRPTGLIYNISNTKDYRPETGVSEVVRDKLLDPDITNPDKPMSAVTLQVAHLLYYSQTSFTIVAHSHGALITRNALRVAYQMGRGPWIQHNVRIIFCGAPLSSESVPTVNQITFKTNPGDLVAQWIGARGGAGSIVAFPAVIWAHSFSEYIPQLSSEMTWPRGSGIREHQERSTDKISESHDSAYPKTKGFHIVNHWIRDINLEYRVNSGNWIPHTIPREGSVPCTGTVEIRFESSRGNWRTLTCRGDGHTYEFRGDTHGVDLFH